MRGPRIFLSCFFSSVGGLLAILSLAASPSGDKLRRPTGFLPEVIEGVIGATLQDVTCVSASDCWAVGYSHPPGGYFRTLVEHWDGTKWSIVPSPLYGQFFSVKCNSTSDCWAVGPGLPAHWDGTAWFRVELATAPFNEVYGVTCVSAADCWLVGRYFNTLGQQLPLIQHWNGISWAVVNAPASSTAILDSVTCNSASDCWSVGGDLALHWNGLAWSQIAAPIPQGLLRDVTCVSRSFCWVVGGTFGQSSIIQKWDGTSWTVTTGTVPTDFLEAITCASSSDCWAVGTGFWDPALIKHWNGATWIDVPAPSPATGVDTLYGISCVTSSDCWAVGKRKNSLDAPLMEHWDGAAWSVAASPPVFSSLVSRMTHGSAGVFDIVLHQPWFECRQGQVAGNYQLVFSFPDNLTSVDSCATTSGSVIGSFIGPNPNQYTVNLAGVPNAQRITLTLETAQDVVGNRGNISATMDVLVGDTTGDGRVNASDVAQTKSRSGEALSSTNFRSDVNADRSINATDTALVKTTVGSALP